jgi:hypothetical protein
MPALRKQRQVSEKRLLLRAGAYSGFVLFEAVAIMQFYEAPYDWRGGGVVAPGLQPGAWLADCVGNLLNLSQRGWDAMVIASNVVLYGVLGLASGTLFPRVALRLTRLPPSGHCRQCNYDLTGNTSGACPECGKEVEAEQQESRPPRPSA